MKFHAVTIDGQIVASEDTLEATIKRCKEIEKEKGLFAEPGKIAIFQTSSERIYNLSNGNSCELEQYTGTEI